MTSLPGPQRLNGAWHITQRILLSALPDPADDPNAPPPPWSISDAATDMARRIARLTISVPRAGLRPARRQRSQRAPVHVDTESDADHRRLLKRIRRGRRDLDKSKDVLVMEYMRYGDLGTWLEKLVKENALRNPAQRLQVSEKVYWSIFHCLWRSCIAMAFPERLDPGDVQESRETLPRDGAPTDPLVHLDLDPSNGMLMNFPIPISAYLFLDSYLQI